jgi:hypothetical protein
LVGSPLLPQLESLCGRRVAMLCAPPERLAAIEQVEACPILTLFLALHYVLSSGVSAKRESITNLTV